MRRLGGRLRTARPESQPCCHPRQPSRPRPVVPDVIGRRIAIFDAEGSYGQGIPLRVQFVPRPGTVPSQSCCAVSGVLEDGSLLVHPPDEIPNEAGPPRHGLFTLLRLSADGAVLDTVLVVVEDDLGVERLELYRIDTTGGGRMDLPPPS